MSRFTSILILLISMSFVAQAAPLRMATYNIQNFNYDDRADRFTDEVKLANIIDEVGADLMAVQEIVNNNAFYSLIADFFPHYQAVLSECGGFGKQHLGFVWNPERLELLEFSEDIRLSKGKDDDKASCHRSSRPASIGLFYDHESESEIVAISLHLKAGGSAQAESKRLYQLGTLFEILSELRETGYENFIVMGDLNTTGYIEGQSSDFYLNFFESMDLYSATQNIACTNYWHGGKHDGLYYPSVLDHILLSGSLFNSYGYLSAEPHGHCAANQCQIKTPDELGDGFKTVSDHCPVSTDIVNSFEYSYYY